MSIHDELLWDTPVTQRSTVAQYLPADAELTEPVLQAIVAVMRHLAAGDEDTWFPDDAVILDPHDDDRFSVTLSYQWWAVLRSKSPEFLEMFAQFVRDGLDPEDSLVAACRLGRTRTFAHSA